MPVLFLLKNLKYAVYVLTFSAGFYVSSQIAQNKLTRELAKQAYEFNTLIDERQQKEKGASDAYQKKIAALSANASNLKRMYGERCYSVSKAASRPDGSPASGELSGTYAVRAGNLIAIAEDAEKVRLQLKALQDFINE